MVAYGVGTSVVNVVTLYMWYKLSNKRFDWKNYGNYIFIILIGVLAAFLNFIVPKGVKMAVIIVALLISNYFLISKKIDKCIFLVLLSQVTIMISDVLFVLIMSLFIGDNIILLQNSPFGALMMNVGIALLMFLFAKSPIPDKVYSYLIKTFNEAKQNVLILCCVATVILAIIMTVTGYTNLPMSIVLLINTIIVIVYIVIMVRLVNAQEKYRKINNKYENSLSSLREYEEMMDKYRIANHENKNQLLTIRNMIKAGDKKAITYIDKIVDNKIKDNENIFYKTSKIPEGGLRATIYSKISKMEQNNISYVLDIANDVRAVDLINMGDDIILNSCKIIGVFLDNAIEEVEKLDKKEITIELFVMDGDLCIDISNNYKGDLEVDKMEKKRYTTKGKNHGYGLALVNEILEEDKCLENEKIISRDIFTQRLIIKIDTLN